MRKLFYSTTILAITFLSSCSSDDSAINQDVETETPTTARKTIVIDEVSQGIAINKVKIYEFVNGGFSVVNQDENNPMLEVKNGDRVRIVYELLTPDAVDSNDFIKWKYGNQGTPETILPRVNPQYPSQLMLSVDFDVVF